MIWLQNMIMKYRLCGFPIRILVIKVKWAQLLFLQPLDYKIEKMLEQMILMQIIQDQNLRLQLRLNSNNVYK